MPSLILTGHPCVGKTTFAHLLAARALRHSSNIITRVVHIRESTSRPDRTKAECYSDSHAEKTTRAALKSEFDRAVMSKSTKDGGGCGGGCGGSGSGDDKKEGGNTLVILDSLNYIKGYRYELYCISKAAGERHGVVWITGDGGSDYGDRSTAGLSPGDELAKRRNRERRELQINRQKQTTTTATTVENEIDLDGYFEDDGTMDDLVLRYEPPDRKNRWENPLYKVDVTSVLPWGKDGTLTTTTTSSGDVASDPDAPASHVENKDDERGEAQSTGRTKETKGQDSSEPSSSAAAGAPKRPAKKSSSGFKRRGKKSAQRASSSSSSSTPATTTRVVAPAAPANNVPSSMASRNLASDIDAPNDDDNNNCEGSGGGKRKMEEVIDGMLDSFLTNVAPLQEGMSTFKNVSSESNMLNQMDDLTRRVNNEILKGQKAASLSAGVGGRIFVALSNDGDGGGGDDGDGTRRRAVNLSKPLHGNELRGFRRQFLKWIAGHPMPVGTREGEMAEGYLAYIESHI